MKNIFIASLFCFLLATIIILTAIIAFQDKPKITYEEYNRQQTAALKKANAEMKNWQAKKMAEAKTARKNAEEPKWPMEK